MRFCNKLITLFFCAISITVYASNFYPVGKVGAKTVYSKKDKCEQIEGQLCFDITTKDPRYNSPVTSMVNDIEKPIYKAPYNTENCDSEQDCVSKVSAKNASCTNGDSATYQKNQVLPGYTIFCTGISGYEQREQTVLVENADLKASVLAADAQKAQLESDIANMQKHIAFGNRMIAYIGVRNKSKGLTKGQVKQMVQDYSVINDLLASGSLLTVKDEIEALVPDGTIVTQSDKDALLAELNSYLGL